MSHCDCQNYVFNSSPAIAGAVPPRPLGPGPSHGTSAAWRLEVHGYHCSTITQTVTVTRTTARLFRREVPDGREVRSKMFSISKQSRTATAVASAQSQVRCRTSESSPSHGCRWLLGFYGPVNLNMKLFEPGPDAAAGAAAAAVCITRRWPGEARSRGRRGRLD